MKNTIILIGMAAGAAFAQAPAAATQEVQKQIHVITAHSGAVSVSSPGSIADTNIFVANEFSLGGKTVTKAPYSAEAVTESVQTLADGNRIANKNTALVYRDGEGRTRREQSLQVALPFASSQTAKKTIIINDPVANVTYILDPDTKTARKISLKMATASSSSSSHSTSGGSVHNENFVFETRTKSPDGKETVTRKTGDEAKAMLESMQKSGKIRMEIHGGAGAPIAIAGGPGTVINSNIRVIHGGNTQNAKIDQLGKRIIEGVECTGTKTTETIAAGAMGNERPIDIITETWTSSDLQTAVQTRRTDPRMGDTTYKLQNLRRGEPVRSLFEVPADYKIEDAKGGGQVMMFQHKSDHNVTHKETTI